MKNNIIIFIVVLLISACTSKDELPDHILDKEQMVNIIAEVELTQAIYKLKFVKDDSLSYYELIDATFSKNKTTQEQFNESIIYYAKYPKKMEEIYNSAIIRLSKEQAKLQYKKKNS